MVSAESLVSYGFVEKRYAHMGVNCQGMWQKTINDKSKTPKYELSIYMWHYPFSSPANIWTADATMLRKDLLQFHVKLQIDPEMSISIVEEFFNQCYKCMECKTIG